MITLADLFGIEAPMCDVTVRPHPCATTAELQHVEVRDADGTVHHFVRKRLGDDPRRVMPAFLRDPDREPWTYEHLLAPQGWCDTWVGRSRLEEEDWLVLRHVPGTQLRYTDDPAAWHLAGRWLGSFHAAAVEPARTTGSGLLLDIDDEWHRRWIERARQAHPGEHELLDAVERVERSRPDPETTIVHGDFHPANLIVGPDGAVTPVDWELTARGDPLHDLACLVSGDLPTQLRECTIGGYLEGRDVIDDVAFRRALTTAQLLVCVQWMGWAAPLAWQPPRGQRGSWAGRATRLLAAR